MGQLLTAWRIWTGGLIRVHSAGDFMKINYVIVGVGMLSVLSAMSIASGDDITSSIYISATWIVLAIDKLASELLGGDK